MHTFFGLTFLFRAKNVAISAEVSVKTEWDGCRPDEVFPISKYSPITVSNLKGKEEMLICWNNLVGFKILTFRIEADHCLHFGPNFSDAIQMYFRVLAIRHLKENNWFMLNDPSTWKKTVQYSQCCGKYKRNYISFEELYS